MGIAILALLLSIFALGAAWTTVHSSQEFQPASQGSLKYILNRGEIRAAVVPIPPLVSIDPNTKEVSGYAVDLLNAIASQAKLRVTYSVADWGNMGTELTSGRSDVICSGVFLTVDRAKEFAFSMPYSYWGIVAVVRKEGGLVSNKADLYKPGLRVAALVGDAALDCAKHTLQKAIVMPMSGSDLTQPMSEVLAGRADVAFGDLATSKRFVAEHSEVQLLFEGNPLNVFSAGFMLRQGDEAFRQFLDIGLQQLNLSGEMERLEAKYEPQKSWLSTPRPWQASTGR